MEAIWYETAPFVDDDGDTVREVVRLSAFHLPLSKIIVATYNRERHGRHGQFVVRKSAPLDAVTIKREACPRYSEKRLRAAFDDALRTVELARENRSI